MSDSVYLVGYVRLEPESRDKWLSHRVRTADGWTDWPTLDIGRYGGGSSDLGKLAPEELDSLARALDRNNREIFEDWSDRHNKGREIHLPLRSAEAERIMGEAWDPDDPATLFTTEIAKENWEESLVLMAAIRSAEQFKKNDAQIDHVAVGEEPSRFDVVQLRITRAESHLGHGFREPITSLELLTQLEEAKALVIVPGKKKKLGEQLDALLASPPHNFLDQWVRALGESDQIEDLFGTDMDIMRLLGSAKRKARPRPKTKK